MILAIPLNGLTLMLLWGWFIAPIGGIGPIGFLHACGVHCVVASLKSVRFAEKDVPDAEIWGRVIARNILCLGVGWIISWFTVT